MRGVSVTSWAQKHAGLTELRDQREVSTIAHTLDMVSRGDVAEAMDVLCQRILAIQQAKSKGGSWDKAANIELLAKDGVMAAPSGMHRLLA